MHHGPNTTTLTVTGSYNGLLSRMAALDHAGILASGRKTLRNAKRQRVEPTIRVTEVIQLTGMTDEDLGFFISCRLIQVVEESNDPVLSFSDVYCLMNILSRFAREGVI